MLIPTITLQPGDSGENVRELQRRLVAVEQLSEDQVNGSYDGPTTEGVRGFQGIHGLNTDGIAGPRTIRKLNAVVAGTASADGDDTRKEEEEIEQEIETSEEIDMALQEQERQKTEDELGLSQPEPDLPPPPVMEEPKMPDLESMGTSDALFLDDPSLETDLLNSKDEHAKEPEQTEKPKDQAPQKPEPEHQAGAELAKAEAAQAPQAPAQSAGFGDKNLEAIDRALPEPVKAEVKQTGQVLMKNGVQQTAVPADMDIGAPSQTPQQQKQQTAELG